MTRQAMEYSSLMGVFGTLVQPSRRHVLCAIPKFQKTVKFGKVLVKFSNLAEKVFCLLRRAGRHSICIRRNVSWPSTHLTSLFGAPADFAAYSAERVVKWSMGRVNAGAGQQAR